MPGAANAAAAAAAGGGDEALATIGAGVEVRASTILAAGNGLFASRPFERGDLITEYDGRHISHAEAQLLRAQGAHTHVRCLSLQHAYVRREGGQVCHACCCHCRESKAASVHLHLKTPRHDHHHHTPP